MRLLLAHDACYCGQLVDELSLAQATVSQHLKVLKDAGLIVGEIEGLRTCYCASRDRLAAAARARSARCSTRRSRWTPVAATETRPRPAAPSPEQAVVLGKLSTLDRFLPLWIALAMAAGLGLGTADPVAERRPRQAPDRDGVAADRAGLLLMMYPVLAKVRYEELGRMSHDGVSNRRFFGVSLFLSWVVGPAADVRARLAAARRPARLPHRRDHRRARPLHRDGARSGTTSPRATATAPRCSSSSTRSSRSPPTRCSATST